MQDNTIELRDITLSYGSSNHPVLDGVNITVSRGSIYGLLGPSGCGKTSVLKVSCVFTCCPLNLTAVYFQIILGLIKPGSGSIVVQSKSAIPGPGVGVMPQNTALHLYFSLERQTGNY